MKYCSIEGCDRKHYCKTFCSLHKQRFDRWGDPLKTELPRHGMDNTPTYRSWVEMKRRCKNPNRNTHPYYFDRGIVYDPRWEQFQNFYVDMGERPEGKTLDRINNNGNYGPDNCRWATAKEQALNRRPKGQV